MNYRNTSVLAHESIATAGVKTIDITLKDVISRISVQIKATNGSNTPTAHPAKIIKKIELVDGSDVLWGLSGKEAAALEFYNTGRTPVCISNYISTEMAIINLNVLFGRFLYDPIMAFDPKKFRNPQLKITHDLALGGSAPSACTLEVVADTFDDKEVTPMGFLMAKELVSYSLNADANEYIDLPTDHMMRKLMIMSEYGGKYPFEQYAEVKISEDNDKRIPFNDKTTDLLKYFCSLYPRVEEFINGTADTSAVDFFCMAAYETQGLISSWDKAITGLGLQQSAGGKIEVIGEAAGRFAAQVKGYAPFGALCLPFGKQDDHADWYDVTKIGNLRATIKAGSSPGSGSTCELVSEQLRKYAA